MSFFFFLRNKVFNAFPLPGISPLACVCPAPIQSVFMHLFVANIALELFIRNTSLRTGRNISFNPTE